MYIYLELIYSAKLRGPQREEEKRQLYNLTKPAFSCVDL